MPNGEAKPGDVYQVFRAVTTNQGAFGFKRHRPCGCVDERPKDTTWTALPRTSTDFKTDDLPSPAMNHPELDKEGVWTYRWVHQVLKEKTGGPACKYLLMLPTDARAALLTFYRDRHGKRS